MPASVERRILRPRNRHDLPRRNVARQLVIASRGSERVVVDDNIEGMLGQARHTARPLSSVRPAPDPLTAEVATERQDERLRERDVDEDALLEALRESHWSIGAAAAMLGVPRSTLYRLIERSPRVRKATDIPAEELLRCHDEHDGDLEAMSTRLQVSKRGLKLRLREIGMSAQDHRACDREDARTGPMTKTSLSS